MKMSRCKLREVLTIELILLELLITGPVIQANV